MLTAAASAQQAGSIRGMVYDKDFDAPLPLARVLIAETGATTTSTDQGNYVFTQVPPGVYTLVFSKQGYVRVVKADIVVSAGRLTEVNAWLSGEFTEMDEFIVQDLQLGPGTTIQLLDLRRRSPALLDSVGHELIGRAALSDAAEALALVPGTTVQEGRFPVVRGLPGRYVNSQMNAVRLPTADPDKRAVQLDQFPAAVIESVQVSKTFTPDQQGDASGGAVNVVLKGVPNRTVVKVGSKVTFNSQASSHDDFLTYDGGGVSYWGRRVVNPQPVGVNWGGAVGVIRDPTPLDYDWSLAAGGSHLFDSGVTVGGFLNFFYKRDVSYYEGGIDDAWWVETPGDPMTPQFSQGTPGQGDFLTSLFDVTKGSEEVLWGGLGTAGLETENHSLYVVYLYTHVAEDVAILAEDTRGKSFYFPGYDPDDPQHPGNLLRDAAPYLRSETLEYTERTTYTLQFTGRHTVSVPEWGLADRFVFLPPEVDWTIARSFSGMVQPDKRLFGSKWLGPSFFPGIPPFIPPFVRPAVHRQFKPSATFALGNLQRVWKEVSEDSDQYFVNVKFPFRQWSGDVGYVKAGLFNDEVSREFFQESFSNFNDNAARFEGPWEEFWTRHWLSQDHPITAAEIDVDYEAEQRVSAWYWMLDFPVSSWLNLVGGVRYESTELSIVNFPERDTIWIPEGGGITTLRPGDADVDFQQDDILPSVGFVLRPLEGVTLRGSYSETLARQTFKELTPIQQTEFLGADVFIGNPALQMSALKNYDVRLDYTPYEGGLFSVSYFHKDISDPIEFVQRVATFVFTTPVNYPEGTLRGFEFEVQQRLGHLWEPLEGLTVGANAAFIDSEVTLPADEAAGFSLPNIMAPMSTRDMSQAPEFLYNVYLTYDLEETGTQFSVFYTVKGDTLVAGAAQAGGNFVPSVYQTEHGTLNVSVTQKLGKYLRVKLQAKNLTNEQIEEVYRSDFIPNDVTKTSFTKGIDWSIGINAEFSF